MNTVVEQGLDKTVWDLITGNVKNVVKVIHNVEKLESLADHFALEDRLEDKSNAHAAELVKRAKARLERMVSATDPAKRTAGAVRQRLTHKQKYAPSEGATGQRGRSTTMSACWRSRRCRSLAACLGLELRIRQEDRAGTVTVTAYRDWQPEIKVILSDSDSEFSLSVRAGPEYPATQLSSSDSNSPSEPQSHAAECIARSGRRRLGGLPARTRSPSHDSQAC